MKDPTPTGAAYDGSQHGGPHHHGSDANPTPDIDRVWFEKNPDRTHRLRNLIPFESKDPLGLPPLGMSWRILVTRTAGGGRLRLPVPLPVKVTNESVDDDRQLSLIFDRIAPSDAVTICRTGMNKKGQKLLRDPKRDADD